MEEDNVEFLCIESSVENMMNTMSYLNTMRKDGSSHDIILKTEDDGSVPANRMVLMGSSDYFKAMFTYNGETKQEILIPGIKSETLELIIEFAYSQPLHVTDDNIWDLIVGADMLLYQQLVTKCYEHLAANMNLTTCLELYEHTQLYTYSSHDFQQKVKTYVVENFKDIPEDTIMEVMAETLEDILRDDRLALREDILWGIVKKWLEKSLINRKDEVARMLGCLRLAYLNGEFIFKHIMCHPLVVNDQQCRDVIKLRQDLMWKLAEVFTSAEVDTPYIARPRLPRDLFFSIGGCHIPSQKTVGIIDVYDSKADLWNPINEGMEFGEARRESHACVFLDNGIYIFGGEERLTGRLQTSAYCWDLEKKKWYSVPPMRQQRCMFSAVVSSGTIIVIGGWQNTYRTLSSAEQFHPIFNTWTFLESMRTTRCLSATAVLNNKIYVCGGSTNRVDNLRTVEVYDCEEYNWDTAASMNECRRGASAAAFKEYIFVAGGRNISSIERYDPRTDHWTMIGRMLEPRFNFALVVLDEVLFAIGGSSGSNEMVNVHGAEAYESENNVWRPVTSSERHITLRGYCVASGVPDSQYYLCQNRENLLSVKKKLVDRYKAKGQMDTAKDSLRIFT